MTPQETLAIVRVVAVAHDRNLPDGLAEVWHATLDDLPFGLVRQAVVEQLRTSTYLPKPAEIRERARLINQQRERDLTKRRQLDGRQEAIEATETARAAGQRTGADMVRHVLGRLKDAGQDAREGKFLGVERATKIAETACREWLDKTREPA